MTPRHAMAAAGLMLLMGVLAGCGKQETNLTPTDQQKFFEKMKTPPPGGGAPPAVGPGATAPPPGVPGGPPAANPSKP